MRKVDAKAHFVNLKVMLEEIVQHLYIVAKVYRKA